MGAVAALVGTRILLNMDNGQLLISNSCFSFLSLFFFFFSVTVIVVSYCHGFVNK